MTNLTDGILKPTRITCGHGPRVTFSEIIGGPNAGIVVTIGEGDKAVSEVITRQELTAASSLFRPVRDHRPDR